MRTTSYLKKFFAEKGIDRDETFTVDGPSGPNFGMSYGVVIDAIKSAPLAEQREIGDKLRRIDFVNGDVRHFLRHLAQALVV